MRNATSIVAEPPGQPQVPGKFSEAGFEALFRRHQRAVTGWILRMVRNHAIAEDLTIETFWRIYRNIEHFDEARGFEPWARRIATRVALDWLRARRPECAMTEEFVAAMPSSTQGDPGIAAEIRTKVAQAFERLPPKLRVAAQLVTVEGCTHREAAQALEISVAAVKLRVFRALRILRKELREQGIKP